ncbi:insulinase family protein [Psychrosphaera ytuae]|uniref:Insulinase family protein n=1 Tax=Psychrosphaera ytuae TaxID=2820710 RepID=A0A975HIW1_9GAMM|nr:pitrilysin family protein [Psychrosphaera ytuae]QTH64588.1 insulinase family protein [Psychrosphaera ytuae]
MKVFAAGQKSKFAKTVIASAMFVALAGCSATQTSSTAPEVVVSNAKMEYVRSVEGIEEYTLSNGMKVLLYPDSAQPKTLVNITYRVGSVHENYGETGMAHLLEHMLFKGSTSYKDIDLEFNKRGMRVNATTWLDRTNYFELFEYDETNLEWALGMEADRMVNATFTAEQLESEMTVVRNEMERGENSPFRMLSSRLSSTAYLWHNYANSTIGARSDVENFPFDKLRAFYKKHYRPDNAVLTLAGRFEKDKAIELIEKTFGKLQQPETPIEPLYTVEPTQDGEREVNLRRTGDVPMIGAVYHVPSALHEDTPALQVLATVLSDSARGRMQKQLVEPGLATGATAFSYLLKDPSIFMLVGQGSKDKDTKEMEKTLISLVEDLDENKVTAEEVATAKAAILKDTEESLRNVTGVGMELSEFIAMGDYRYIFYFRDLVEKVTVEDVQRVAEKYFVSSNRTIGRFIPTKEPVRAEISEAKDISEILADYKGRKAVESGEVYDNTVENVLARLQEFEWQTGTKVSVYPKKLRAGEVHIAMNFPVGSDKTLKGYEADFKLLGGLLFSGTKTYSKADIASKLDALKASVSISTRSLGEINVSIKAVKENLDETLLFVQELMTNPAFDEAEIEIDRKASITGLEMSRSEPRSVALNALNKAFDGYGKDSAFGYKTIDEQIDGLKAVNQKRLKALHKSLFDASNGFISVVGDVEPEAISKDLEAYFGGIDGSADYIEPEQTFVSPAGLDMWIETPDKANAQLYIAHTVDLNEQHPDFHAAYIANQIFGGSGFASRLMQRIRVKEGYSYGTGSGLGLEYDEEKGLFYMSAIAAPENMKKVVEAYKEEVQKVLDNGFTEKEVKDAIEGALKSQRVTWSSESYIARMLNENKKVERDIRWFKEYQDKVQGLTVEQVNEAFAKYIATQELNVFAAGDWAKVNKQ